MQCVRERALLGLDSKEAAFLEEIMKGGKPTNRTACFALANWKDVIFECKLRSQGEKGVGEATFVAFASKLTDAFGRGLPGVSRLALQKFFKSHGLFAQGDEAAEASESGNSKRFDFGVPTHQKFENAFLALDKLVSPDVCPH